MNSGPMPLDRRHVEQVASMIGEPVGGVDGKTPAFPSISKTQDDSGFAGGRAAQPAESRHQPTPSNRWLTNTPATIDCR